MIPFVLLLQAPSAEAYPNATTPVSGTFRAPPASPERPPAPPPTGRVHLVRWDPSAWRVDGLRMPIVDLADVLGEYGLRAGPGPDGRPWVASSEVTVLVDGLPLGDGLGWVVPDLLPTHEPWKLRR